MNLMRYESKLLQEGVRLVSLKLQINNSTHCHFTIHFGIVPQNLLWYIHEQILSSIIWLLIFYYYYYYYSFHRKNIYFASRE